jgi:hypothetical protein
VKVEPVASAQPDFGLLDGAPMLPGLKEYISQIRRLRESIAFRIEERRRQISGQQAQVEVHEAAIAEEERKLHQADEALEACIVAAQRGAPLARQWDLLVSTSGPAPARHAARASAAAVEDDSDWRGEVADSPAERQKRTTNREGLPTRRVLSDEAREKMRQGAKARWDSLREQKA